MGKPLTSRFFVRYEKVRGTVVGSGIAEKGETAAQMTVEDVLEEYNCEGAG